MRSVIALGLLGLSLSAWAKEGPVEHAAKKWDFSEAALIPTQSGGRVKPLDSLAREAVLFVTGSRSFADYSPVETLLSWLSFPEHWESEQVIYIGTPDVRKQLLLDSKRKRFAPSELVNNPVFLQYATEVARESMGADEASKAQVTKTSKPDPRMQELRRVVERLSLYRQLTAGNAWTLLPREGSAPWGGLNDQSAEGKELANRFRAWVMAYREGKREDFERSAVEIRGWITGQISDWNESRDRLNRIEVLYNSTRPFYLAWILYLVAGILWTASIIVSPKKGQSVALVGLLVSGLAFIVHVFGFALRVLVSGRPPVTNMYESIIWVSFGVLVFAWILYGMYRQRVIMAVACFVAMLALLAGDASPTLMDPGIHPLVPVLRSNLWLTIHVLTITLSYAAFALALGLGNVSLYHFASKHQEKALNLNQLTYRTLQFGVVLLAAGTILGGVWADYSWGRFWGWDPKEVWALIALLCYLVFLHGRFAGWVGNFGFAVGSVVAFLSVLMAWYGVNFVLGVGLHSYGFSSGGGGAVGGFVALQLAYVAWASLKTKGAPWKHKKRST